MCLLYVWVWLALWHSTWEIALHFALARNVFSYFSFGVVCDMWNLIASVPGYLHFQGWEFTTFQRISSCFDWHFYLLIKDFIWPCILKTYVFYWGWKWISSFQAWISSLISKVCSHSWFLHFFIYHVYRPFYLTIIIILYLLLPLF